MKNILVPIDFSPCSINAFLYAREIAQELGVSLKVVHIYTGNLNASESLVLRPGKTKHESMELLLQEFVERESGNQDTDNTLTKVRVETEAILAFSITLKLLKLTTAPDTIMVVMGTNGAGNSLDKMLGSVSSAVAQRAKCPVLLIPRKTRFRSIGNIMYASNYQSIQTDNLKQIIDFGKLFEAAMHFVHVEGSDEYEEIETTVFDTVFEEEAPGYSFNIVNLKGKSVMQELNQYAEENHIDLMVLVNHQRKFIDNLLGLSLTRQMALNINRPLLVFHFEK